MYLAARTDGRFWDGFGWNQEGKSYLSIGSVKRSLHENGEDFSDCYFLPIEKPLFGVDHDASEKLSTWSPQTIRV